MDGSNREKEREVVVGEEEREKEMKIANARDGKYKKRLKREALAPFFSGFETGLSMRT